MNDFAKPACGVGAWYSTYDFRAHYRHLAAMRIELGDRVFPYVNTMGENQYGDGYDYARRICVVYRAREAQRLAADGYPAPPDGQLVLL